MANGTHPSLLNLGGLRANMLYQDPSLPYGYRDDLSWGPVVSSATPARDFVSMPEDYAAVYADIPEEHRRSIATPYGTVAAHAATYDPYSQGRTVSRGAVTEPTSDLRGTPEYSGPKYKYTPSNGSFKRELANPVDGDQRMEGNSVYTWVDGGWQYHGESGTPNLVNKDQFVKNYYEQKTEIEKQTEDDAVVAAVPPTAGQAPPASVGSWGYVPPWGVASELPALNMAPASPTGSWGYVPPTSFWDNISMDALTQALTDITSGT